MCDKPFSLSVKIILQDDENRWLLLRRSSRSVWNPGKWEIPGGKIQINESIQETVLRETLEETGLETKIQGVLGAVEDETENLRLAHLILVGDLKSKEINLSNEHDKYAWASFEEMQDMDLCGYMYYLIRLWGNYGK